MPTPVTAFSLPDTYRYLHHLRRMLAYAQQETRRDAWRVEALKHAITATEQHKDRLERNQQKRPAKTEIES